jgi:hypothetical protein
MSASEMKRASLLLAFLLVLTGLLAGRASAVSSAVANPWTGKWLRPAAEFGGSSTGVTTLTQNGASVTGSYDWHGGGTISGTASGSTLEGTWSEAKGSGTFHLTLAANALSFSGTTEGTTGTFKGLSGSWTGTYIGTRPAPVTTTTPSKKPWPALPDALVPIASVSNGCGGGDASAQGKFGDTSTYKDSNVNPAARSYMVNFREACKLHDAGYSGARVRDALHGGAVVDFFKWTKAEVDKKFFEDMILICERTIPASATTALANCKATGGNVSTGARSRFNFVDRFGSLFWKDRPNVRGLWAVTGDAAAPPWAITQSTRMVKAAWRGGTGQPNLRGEFRGTLISRDQDTVIRGFAQITRNGETKLGAMSLLFTPGTVLADKIVVLGPGMRATLKR